MAVGPRGDAVEGHGFGEVEERRCMGWTDGWVIGEAAMEWVMSAGVWKRGRWNAEDVAWKLVLCFLTGFLRYFAEKSWIRGV